jgi:magnesium-transporting ATPase (P-type)
VAVALPTSTDSAAVPPPVAAAVAAALPAGDVLERLGSSGPISSVFDFITFGVMLWGFHAGPALFRSGWFVESLATQTLVIFAIRTRRIPFFRSRPSVPLLLAALAVVTMGAVLPATTLGHLLGFQPLPGPFFLALTLMVIAYLALIEPGKYWFSALTGPLRNLEPRGRSPAVCTAAPPASPPTTACGRNSARADRPCRSPARRQWRLS